jgi:hypothetical protein
VVAPTRSAGGSEVAAPQAVRARLAASRSVARVGAAVGGRRAGSELAVLAGLVNLLGLIEALSMGIRSVP